MTEQEKMLRGQFYNTSDPELVSMRFAARRLTEKFNNTSISQIKKRRRILSKLFGSVKTNFYIEPMFNCDYGCHIHIGENFYANYGCVFLDVAEIRIGDNVVIAGNPAKIIKLI